MRVPSIPGTWDAGMSDTHRKTRNMLPSLSDGTDFDAPESSESECSVAHTGGGNKSVLSENWFYMERTSGTTKYKCLSLRVSNPEGFTMILELCRVNCNNAKSKFRRGELARLPN